MVNPEAGRAIDYSMALAAGTTLTHLEAPYDVVVVKCEEECLLLDVATASAAP